MACKIRISETTAGAIRARFQRGNVDMQFARNVLAVGLQLRLIENDRSGLGIYQVWLGVGSDQLDPAP
jgi:hypothetical protein